MFQYFLASQEPTTHSSPPQRVGAELIVDHWLAKMILILNTVNDSYYR